MKKVNKKDILFMFVGFLMVVGFVLGFIFRQPNIQEGVKVGVTEAPNSEVVESTTDIDAVEPTDEVDYESLIGITTEIKRQGTEDILTAEEYNERFNVTNGEDIVNIVEHAKDYTYHKYTYLDRVRGNEDTYYNYIGRETVAEALGNGSTAIVLKCFPVVVGFSANIVVIGIKGFTDDTVFTDYVLVDYSNIEIGNTTDDRYRLEIGDECSPIIFTDVAEADGEHIIYQ